MMMIITRYNTCDAFITLMMMMIICINLDDDLPYLDDDLPVNMEYDNSRDERHGGDCIEGEPNMFQADRVVCLVAWAEVVM